MQRAIIAVWLAGVAPVAFADEPAAGIKSPAEVLSPKADDPPAKDKEAVPTPAPTSPVIPVPVINGGQLVPTPLPQPPLPPGTYPVGPANAYPLPDHVGGSYGPRLFHIPSLRDRLAQRDAELCGNRVAPRTGCPVVRHPLPPIPDGVSTRCPNRFGHYGSGDRWDGFKTWLCFAPACNKLPLRPTPYYAPDYLYFQCREHGGYGSGCATCGHGGHAATCPTCGHGPRVGGALGGYGVRLPVGRGAAPTDVGGGVTFGGLPCRGCAGGVGSTGKAVPEGCDFTALCGTPPPQINLPGYRYATPQTVTITGRVPGTANGPRPVEVGTFTYKMPVEK